MAVGGSTHVVVGNDPIYYSQFGNGLLVEKTTEEQTIEYVKTTTDIQPGSMDDKVYQSFLLFYYALYVGDADVFYQSMDDFSLALSNHNASKVRDQVPIQVSYLRIKPGRI